MKKKALSISGVIAMGVLFALSGCQNNEAGGEAEDGSLNVSYFVGMVSEVSANVKDLNEVAAYKQLEEKTGVTVDFQHPPVGGDYNQQFNLMMASGELPDVIERNWAQVPGGINKYANEKKLVKLNDYLSDHAPNLSKVLAENPDWKKMISTDDGGIYVFPFIRGEEKLLTFFGPIIRQDWLDTLGLEKPETIDEWHHALTQIKTNDPNGNGEADEIPLLPDLNANAFVGAFGAASGFYQEEGTVKYGPIEPEFKDFIELMKKWYEEGLIDPDYMATDKKLRDAKVTGNQLGSFVSYAGSGIGYYMGLMEESNPNFQLAPTVYPSLNKGELADFAHVAPVYDGYGAAITTSNPDIEETIEWMDYKYGEEGHMLFNFGIEGESYEIIDGYPTFTETITDNEEGLPMVQALGMYVQSSYYGPFVQDVRYIEQYMTSPAQKEAVVIWGKGKNEKDLPVITPTEQESSELSSIMNDVNTYKDSMVNKFVIGEESMENYDNFVETIKSMGMTKAIEINQAALDRYEAR
ncbi:extracellular solute-binding protein [Aureibacillus halotolerans]|uniref:Putative aldouronate transport system substrate-binding protein n=1 Tax=Aureibacillus halotolerans TaxID=1508390 RepID=A0A4R6U4J4_9BACI|nr:extracellular solute-binding protein [Aureibacillus halotolerans]TDQ41071.1 putative aldouronate transport system substrate-binding protein [Aureibacillus halotolerans]